MWAFYRWFFIALPVRHIEHDAFLQILNEQEAAYLHWIRRRAMWLGALSALICNVLLFAPLQLAPHLFPLTVLKLPFFAEPVPLPIIKTAWMGFLIFLEIVLLTLLNIAAVHEVAVATGYINEKTEVARTNDVLRIALATPSQELQGFGIDPFQGVNRFALLFYNALLLFKGAIMAQLLRQILIRLLGGYTVLEVLDWSGVPIYMTLNALGARKVVHQSLLIIMGEAVILNFRRRLLPRALTAEESALLYDTLQFIAVNKRDYHRNHYTLTRVLFNFYQVPPEEKHPLPDDYEMRLNSSPEYIRRLCVVIIHLGFVLDGALSWRERGRIARMQARGIFEESFEDVYQYDNDFVQGRGMVRLWDRYFPPLENALNPFLQDEVPDEEETEDS